MEKLPYWRIRMRKEALYLETDDGKCYEFFGIESSASPSKIESFQIQRFAHPSLAARARDAIPEPRDSPLLVTNEDYQQFTAADIQWNAGGVEISTVPMSLRVARLFWRPRTDQKLA
ncbi:hypothetical protein HDU67_003749 [Dinochytrium kinnereticum]|nr:hypothetical protein HDU67_003749 [Dinochytrium kinnereticum]